MRVGEVLGMNKKVTFCDYKGNEINNLDGSYVSWEVDFTDRINEKIMVHIVPNTNLAKALWVAIKGTVATKQMPYLLTIEELAKAMQMSTEKMLAIMWGLASMGYTQREQPFDSDCIYWVVE